MTDFPDANEFLLGGGVPSAKFEKVGDYVLGVITRRPEVQQTRDFETGAPEFWEGSGKPKLQVRVIVQTEGDFSDTHNAGKPDPQDPDDNGERALYAKGNMQKAVAKASASTGGIQVGGKLFVRYTGDGQAKGRLNPPKLFEAKYQAPANAPVSMPDESQQAPQGQPVVAQVGAANGPTQQQAAGAGAPPPTLKEIPFGISF